MPEGGLERLLPYLEKLEVPREGFDKEDIKVRQGGAGYLSVRPMGISEICNTTSQKKTSPTWS